MNNEALGSANAMFDFLSEAAGAKNKENIVAPLYKAARHFGFDWFAISGVPLPGERIDPYVMLNAWPQEWYERYLMNNYVHVDPVIYLCKMQDSPFVWSEALANHELSRPARRVMNEARQFALNDGFSVPLHTAGGFQGIVTFGAKRVDLSIPARISLHTLSIYAYNTLRMMTAQKTAVPNNCQFRTTAREREIIQWCAAGKTASEIAEILGRSHRTIQNQILKIQRKLNVVNTAQMIAESFRSGTLR